MNNYHVIFSGVILDGFEITNVKQALAAKFKLTPEKAERLFSGQSHTLKRDIDHKTAYQYKSILEKLGASIELKPVAAAATTLSSLSLVPTEEEIKQKEQAQREQALKQQAEKASKQPASITCPKCASVQSNPVECDDCGIIFAKYAKHQAQQPMPANLSLEPMDNRPVPETVSQVSEAEEEGAASEASVIIDNDELNIAAIIAAVVATVIGAFVWQGIAIAFEVELGYIAWGIGGLIGVAALMFDARGQTIGIICGVLAVVAIFAGKYMAYDSLKETWQQEFLGFGTEFTEEFRSDYEQEKLFAQEYEQVKYDDEKLKVLIFEWGYTDANQVSDMGDADIAFFRDNVASRLEQLNQNNMTFEQWHASVFATIPEVLSTTDLMKENFGAIDLIFLFLGVGTAYRLARGNE
ncbi:MAG: hypothetical protein HWE13_13745 [Gammaproteobacteria bacterium]|nr:hypothetical protein [Gammaproteobacteria bacterium]